MDLHDFSKESMLPTQDFLVISFRCIHLLRSIYQNMSWWEIILSDTSSLEVPELWVPGTFPGFKQRI